MFLEEIAVYSESYKINKLITHAKFEAYYVTAAGKYS